MPQAPLLLRQINVTRTSLDHLLLGKCADVDTAETEVACRMKNTIYPDLLRSSVEKWSFSRFSNPFGATVTSD